MMTAKLLIPKNKQLLAEAWQQISGTKWHFFMLFLVALIWGCIIALAVHEFHLDTWITVNINSWGMIVMPIMAAIGSSVFFLGATSMGVARARDQEVSLRIALSPWRKLFKVIVILFSIMIINLLVGNLVNGIGFTVAATTKQPNIVYATLIIADLLMILVNTFFVIAIPITIDTQHGPFKSMHLSLSHMRHHVWQGFLLMITLYLLALLSIFTLFIAYLWILPLTFILFGQLYLRLMPQQP